MDDVYFYTRIFHFAWSFVLLLGLIHWGVQDIILNRRCGHVQVPPEHQLWAASTLGAIVFLQLSIGEQFLNDVEGGFRTFLPGMFLLPSTFALHQGRYRVKAHRALIERNACGGSHSAH